MTFLVDGQILEIREKNNTIIVYGDFADKTTGRNFVIVKIPAGRIPWSKKIYPAIKQRIKEIAKRGFSHINVEGESTIVAPGNKFRDTMKDMPFTVYRLWDHPGVTKYEWNATDELLRKYEDRTMSNRRIIWESELKKLRQFDAKKQPKKGFEIKKIIKDY